MWDVANTIRLAQLKSPPLFGLATDDTHDYHGDKGANPGRGWIQVESRYLSPEHLIRAIKAGRVWTNCYHAYPAHATFGGYKESGIGRETHKMMLDHYQQTKNLLVSYSPNKLGFF